jgi:hypothetical protein
MEGQVEAPLKPSGDLHGGTVVVRVYADKDGGLLAVEYPEERLSIDLFTSVIANLIRDTFGDEPSLKDIAAMQRTLIATLQGGASAGERTK